MQFGYRRAFIRRLHIAGPAKAGRRRANAATDRMRGLDRATLRPDAGQRSGIARQGGNETDGRRPMHGRSIPSDATTHRLPRLGFGQAVGRVRDVVELQPSGGPARHLPHKKRDLPKLEPSGPRDPVPLEGRVRDCHRSWAKCAVRCTGRRRWLPAIGGNTSVRAERYFRSKQAVHIRLRRGNRMALMIEEVGSTQSKCY